MQAVVEELFLERVTAAPRCPIGNDIDAGEQAVAAKVRYDRQSLERPERLQEVGRQRGAALEQAFITIDVERGEARGAGRGMARVGIAMEKLDRAFGGRAEDRIVDSLADRHRPHGLRAIGKCPWPSS